MEIIEMPLARPSGRTSTRASVPASALARGLTCALVMACVGAALASTAENPYETLRDLARSGGGRADGSTSVRSTSRRLGSNPGTLCQATGNSFCDVELNLTPVLGMLPAGTPAKEMCGLIALSGLLPDMAMGMWRASCCVADCTSCAGMSIANEQNICSRDDPKCDLEERGATITAHGPRSGSSISYDMDRPHERAFEGAGYHTWRSTRTKERIFHPKYYPSYYPFEGAWAKLASALDPENRTRSVSYTHLTLPTILRV